MNQAKAMKATLKSSTEKKQPIESTTPNNEVLPKLRSTLSARNIMLGPNYDEEINKTVVSRHPDAVTVVTGTVGCAGLKGPSVQKSFNSWAVTTVVEYFHLLPYAAIL
ncbi:hypothetical protein TB1_041201 [Malus domestica]